MAPQLHDLKQTTLEAPPAAGHGFRPGARCDWGFPCGLPAPAKGPAAAIVERGPFVNDLSLHSSPYLPTGTVPAERRAVVRRSCCLEAITRPLVPANAASWWASVLDLSARGLRMVVC